MIMWSCMYYQCAPLGEAHQAVLSYRMHQREPEASLEMFEMLIVPSLLQCIWDDPFKKSWGIGWWQQAFRKERHLLLCKFALLLYVI